MSSCVVLDADQQRATRTVGEADAGLRELGEAGRGLVARDERTSARGFMLRVPCLRGLLHRIHEESQRERHEGVLVPLNEVMVQAGQALLPWKFKLDGPSCQHNKDAAQEKPSGPPVAVFEWMDANNVRMRPHREGNGRKLIVFRLRVVEAALHVRPELTQHLNEISADLVAMRRAVRPEHMRSEPSDPTMMLAVGAI